IWQARYVPCGRDQSSRQAGRCDRVLQPLARLQEIVQACLGAAGFGGPLIAPTRRGRHGEQNGLCTPAGLQAKEGAPVKDEVELDIAATAVTLEISLTLAVRRIHAASDNGKIGIGEAITHGLNQAKSGVEAICIDVIKE